MAQATERLKQELRKLRECKQRLGDFISTASDLLWETDAEMNFVSGECLGGAACKDHSITAACPQITAMLDELRTGPFSDSVAARESYRGLEYSIPGPSNTALWLESNGNPVFNAAGDFLGYRGTCRNITERKANESTIAFLARYDSLTKLPNRVLFRERIEQALARATPESRVAVLCLDLDRFKVVNDTLGHSTGDALLRTVADRLSRCVRSIDTVARLGGDEFVVIQVGLEKAEEAAALANRIEEALNEPCVLDGHYVTTKITIGIALTPEDGTSPEELLRHADIALYRAKFEEPGTWCFFEAHMGARVESRRSLETGMRDAIVRNEFELDYQPLYSVASHEVLSVEALLRWRHPVRGVIGPNEFIPIAEESGLIVPIGEWVLRRACRDAMQWPGGRVSVAVNLSPVQFKSRRLVAAVKEALAESGLPGHRLELEITEAVLMQSGEATLRALHELRNLGARVSLDDFGTGYSSLSYLRSFPFDKIKIDQSFIRDLTGARGGAAIVRAIAGLGASLSLATTAEGVETPEQFAILQAEGCTEVQGFLFSRPVPARNIPALIGQIPPGLPESDLAARFPWPVNRLPVPNGENLVLR
ncbi:MAG TPA: EAL domain-containing protein [Bryobacteraceae bacterium]|nr:EAL domain-containing protein [Bryobacteraceae bacterium]